MLRLVVVLPTPKLPLSQTIMAETLVHPGPSTAAPQLTAADAVASYGSCAIAHGSYDVPSLPARSHVGQVGLTAQQ